MRTDYLGLEAFLCVAELGSFSAAAQMLNLSQTAISHRVRKLEESLDVRLFLRTGKELRLTETGANLLPTTRELLHGIRIRLDEIRNQRRLARNTLAIGCLPMTAMTFLPTVLRQFNRSHGDVAILISDISPHYIEEQVRNGSLELGITNIAVNHPDMKVRELFTEEYAVICPVDHPFARKTDISWADLEDVPLIRIGAANGYHQFILSQAMGKKLLDLRWIHEVQHINTAIGLVAEGIALTIAPLRYHHRLFGSSIKVLPLRDPAVSRRVGILSRSNAPPSANAMNFCNLLRDIVRANRAELESEVP